MSRQIVAFTAAAALRLRRGAGRPAGALDVLFRAVHPFICRASAETLARSPSNQPGDDPVPYKDQT